MTIELPREVRAEAIKSIERYFEVNMEERIGNIQAGITVSIIPCMACYLLLQKYYVAVFTAGAVK